MQSSQVGVNGRKVFRVKVLTTGQAAQNLDDYYGRILRYEVAGRHPGKDA